MHENDTSLESLADWLRKTAERDPKDREFVAAEWWRKAAHAVERARADQVRMDWLCKHTEFRFQIFDSATKKFLRENHAMGVVIRPVVDAAMEKYPNP